MANKTKSRSSQHTIDHVADLNDHQLQATLDEFLAEEKKENNNIWNFATIAGIAVFFVAMVFFIQSLGLSIGPDLTGSMGIISLIAGLLVTMVGFGYLLGDRKKEKRKQRKKRNSQKYSFDYDFEDTQSDEDEEEEHNFGTTHSKTKSSESYDFDSYAFRQSKKLYKSRTNKKFAGVCGGLAKYTGISPTVIRLLFVVTFFAGSGASLLAYIALAIALDKEPVGIRDDFDF